MVSSLIIAQIVYAMIGTDHMVENSFKQSYFSSDDAHYSSLKNYFQEDMFNKLKKNTTDNTLANVICLGFVPAIAHFNGFYSLDAYQNVYLIEYKHKFRKIIEGELEKNSLQKSYFDQWGNKCYAFLGEKPENGTIKNLVINLSEFKSMNGNYLLSAYCIDNSEQIGLELLSVNNDESKTGKLERIFLYKTR